MILRHNKKSIIHYLFSVFIILVFFYSYSTASVTNYPTEGWQSSSPERQGMSSKMLAKMIEHIKSNNINIDSLSIIRNGYMVLDAYFYPFSKKQKHDILSCTKSIMSALIGIAIDKGYIKSIDQPITDFFPVNTFAGMDDLKKSITLENLLMMASGLKCRDSYLYGWVGLREMRNSNDWAQHVLDLPMAETPGEKFEYCSGTSHLLSVIIHNATQTKTIDFARRYLFEPLGIIDIEWGKSPQGIEIGAGEMWLKPHDMAKFGWLYLNKGRWGNRQIVASAWVETSTQGHIDATRFDQYGYQWWVDSAGYYAALGNKGQRIFIVPGKNLVAVFTGYITKEEDLVTKSLLDFYIIPAASELESLPPNEKGQARLDALVNSVATAIGFTWITQNEGLAKDGVFKRTAPPAFNFEYPVGCKKAATYAPGQVMRMECPGGIEIYSSVVDIPEGIKLDDFGPKLYIKGIESMGSNVQIISNKQITLKCGTKAYKTKFKWMWDNNLPITTFLVSAYMGAKCIFIDGLTWENYDKLELVVHSLTFE